MSKQPLPLERLFPELDQIADPALRQSVVDIWNDLWAMSAYEKIEDVRVSLKIDYEQLKHTQGTLRAALACAEIWSDVHGVSFDRDTLIAGALLMDASKVVETEPDSAGGHRASSIGANLPHATYVAHLALSRGVPLEVVHIITCHSPNGGKAPRTPEARLLDWIDQADISAFGFEIWTRKVQHFQP
jgi:HD domain-containing protein